MPSYRFKALNAEGHTRSGTWEASSEKAARQAMRQQGLIALSLVPATARRTRFRADVVLWEPRVFTPTTRCVWTRQLASLLAAGLPLERALLAMSDPSDAPRHRALTDQLRAAVNEGASLSQAMASCPKAFDPRDVAVVASGEQSGRLAHVMQQLASHLEAQWQMRTKLLSASLYPAIVTVVALCMVLFLLVYVVPQVTQVFTSTQRRLPLLTVWMLTLSHWVQRLWLWALCGGLAMAGLLRWARQQPAFRRRMDAAWLRLPVLGRLSAGHNASQFASTLALLIGAGLPMLKALQTAADTLSNTALRQHATQSIELVREGATLASALSQNDTLPRVLTLFARLGEETGALPQMLQHAADHLSNDVQRRATQLATVTEPVLIVTMGAVVMLIVLSVMLPIIQLNQFVK